MIRKLRVKLIVITTGSLLLTFAVLFASLNIWMHRESDARTFGFLRMVAENDGLLLPQRTVYALPQQAGVRIENPEWIISSRFFYVKIYGNGEVLEMNLEMMFDFTESDAVRYLDVALKNNSGKGTAGNMSYVVADKPYGKIAVFAERNIENSMLLMLSLISVWAMVITLPVAVAMSMLLSKWAVRPVKSAFDKQRRFISDASHELKTPLTVISANADVLRNEIGENERLTHIGAQVERMSLLVHELLALARTDEDAKLAVNKEFSLSDTVLSAVLEFESRAFEEHKTYDYDVAENVKYSGDEQQIKQLLSILLDNALRYSDENGSVRVSLTQEANSTRVSVRNTGTGIPDEERDKVFDRFYRSDDSRSRATGGYGLGLAIAKAIADAHRAKITVTGEYGKWVEFNVTL